MRSERRTAVLLLLAVFAGLPSAEDGVVAWLGYINLSLLVFNLLPALPLDGGRVLHSLLWYFKGDLAWATRIAADVEGAWEVLGEAVQTVMRCAGVPGGYERLKEFTRGRVIDAQALADFIDTLPLAPAEKSRLKALRPEDYTGLAARLAREIR